MSLKSFAAALSFTVMCIITVTPTSGQSVIASIPVNGTPLGVAVNPVDNRIYAAIFPTSVAVIDGATNSLLETVSLPFGASRVAVDPFRKRVYIAGCDFTQVLLTCGLSVLGSSNNMVVGSTQISSNGAIGIQGLAVNPQANRIYVSDADNFEVDVIDGEGVTVIANISFGRQQPLGLAVEPHPDRVFATINGNEVADEPSQIQRLRSELSIRRSATNAPQGESLTGANPSPTNTNPAQ